MLTTSTSFFSPLRRRHTHTRAITNAIQRLHLGTSQRTARPQLVALVLQPSSQIVPLSVQRFMT